MESINNIYVDKEKLITGTYEWHYLAESMSLSEKGRYVYFNEFKTSRLYKGLELSNVIKEGTQEVDFKTFREILRKEKPLYAILEVGDCIKFGNEYFTTVEYTQEVKIPSLLTIRNQKTFYHKTGKYSEEIGSWGSRNALFAFDGLRGSIITKEEFDKFNKNTYPQPKSTSNYNKVLNKIGKDNILKWLEWNK